MLGISRTSSRSSQDAPAPRQKTRQVWTPDEDQKLSEAVAKETPKNGTVSWHKVAGHLPGRNNKDCRKRWHYSIANTIRKGTWMREEDERLREAVELYGARWSKIAEAVGTRNGDQCWKRWYDCLDPRIDKSPWTPEEDAKLLDLVSKNGRNWSDIVHQHFPNRTSLSAKNRYSILRRKQAGNASKTKAESITSSPSLGHNLSIPPTPSPSYATPEPDMVSSWMDLSQTEIDELLQPSYQMAAYTDTWYTGSAGSDASASPSPYMGCDLDWNGSSPDAATTAAWPSPACLGSDSNLLAPPPANAYYPRSQPSSASSTANTTGMGYNILGIYQHSMNFQQTSSAPLYESGEGLMAQNAAGSFQYGLGRDW